ncbi:MAG: three component ABC system middle component [Desulfuromonadaceae bacterium]
MTCLADALYRAKYNPFRYAEFLGSFYSELTNVDNNLLLSQLVIPLCSHHLYFHKLSNAKFGSKSKSTIWTIFDDRTQMFDLQERLDDFKALTEQSLQYCLVNDWLGICVQTLTVTLSPTNEAPFMKQKSAVNLGKLLSNFSVVEIYALLGVIPR